MSKRNFLIGLTGSIACYKTCTLLSQLVKAGHEVQVVATPSALKFVGEATLEGLTGRPVLSDTFTSGQMMSHITLARWADVFLIAPLTANHLNKLATGAADDLLTTLALAYERNKPFLVAPAMNTVMYDHPTVQDSLKKLRSFGVQILEPTAGRLACGEEGYGKMMEPEDLLRNILNEPTKSAKRRVLITFGGTREPIDAVRAITNTSTGETGAALADEFTQRGYDVTALASVSAHKPQLTKNIQQFENYEDLRQAMTELLSKQKFDAVIHLAAVSDFSVDKIQIGGKELTPSKKIKMTSKKSISLKLKTNPKIVNSLKSISKNKNISVVAFKLTNTESTVDRKTAVTDLLKSSKADLVVHNDLSEIDKANNKHVFNVYAKNKKTQTALNVSELAKVIYDFMS